MGTSTSSPVTREDHSSVLQRFPSFTSLSFPRVSSHSTMISKLAIASIASAACASAHLVKRDDGVYSNTLYKRDGGSHSHSSSSSSSYGAPEPSYSAPSPSYSAPAPSPSYGAPEPSYSAPEPSYSAPSPSYSAPA